MTLSEYVTGVDYEHDHHDAEHEHAEMPEQSAADKGLELPHGYWRITVKRPTDARGLLSPSSGGLSDWLHHATIDPGDCLLVGLR